MIDVSALPAGIRERIREATVELGTAVLVVDRADLPAVLTALRDEHGFSMLADLSAVDWLPAEPRFHVNYHLYAVESGERIRVKVKLPGDDPSVPSATGVWPAADWYEREAYDLMGISFPGHPNLRRILMPDGWIGHPHRKDYPIGGVPVEYKIEPSYVGADEVSVKGRPSAGGVPGRLWRDRGKRSAWTWTGLPATGVREREQPPAQEPPSDA